MTEAGLGEAVKKIGSGVSIKALHSTVLCLCALVHGVYLILFCFMELWPLLAVNVASVVLYLLLAGAAQRGRFMLALGAAHAEIMLHSVLAAVFLGWGGGFEYVILCLLTLEAHFLYRRRMTSYLLSGVEIAVVVALKIFTLMYPPLHEQAVGSIYEQIFFFVNITLFFLGIVLSAALFDRNNGFSRLVLEESNKYLTLLAETDPLTGLLNRRSMIKRLEDAVKLHRETDEEFCLVMCDIDDFKQINDAFGHACGDYVLKMLCATICEYLDEQDTVCRWGGEEILMMLNDTRLDDAMEITEGLRRAIETTSFVYDGAIISITVTMGVCAGRDELSAADMIDAADRYMYNGKRSGKNCVTKS